jgi:hypothetical protein
MRYDRDKMLADFLSCKETADRVGLSVEELNKIDFSIKTDNPIIESLKILIRSFCNDETPSVILRKMNMQIDLLTKDSTE